MYNYSEDFSLQDLIFSLHQPICGSGRYPNVLKTEEFQSCNELICESLLFEQTLDIHFITKNHQIGQNLRVLDCLSYEELENLCLEFCSCSPKDQKY